MMLDLKSFVPREVQVSAGIPRAGLVTSTILSMCTISVLAVCLTRRIEGIRDWVKVPLTRWLILMIYAVSVLFTFTTAILEHGLGLSTSYKICDSAILLCLACYMSTKLIYYFLVEKVYIIRSVSTPRLRSKLYCFNCFGMLLPYGLIVILNFIYRTAYITPAGVCIIGMQFHVMLPLILFDAAVNLYLTLLFVIPLRKLYSYRNNSSSKAKSMLHTIALRSFVGSLGTLTSSVVNLTVLMVLKGEAAWICLMCCNADVMFSVLVLHWVTGRDQGSQSTHSGPGDHSLPQYATGSKLKRKVGASAVGKLDRFETFSGSQIRSKSYDELGGVGSGVGSGVVTTHITAQEAPATKAILRSKPRPSEGSVTLTSGKGNASPPPILEDEDGTTMLEHTPASSPGHEDLRINRSMGGIKVEVGHVVEVEVGPLSKMDVDDTGYKIEELGFDGEDHDGDGDRHISRGRFGKRGARDLGRDTSTEDLVEKRRDS